MRALFVAALSIMAVTVCQAARLNPTGQWEVSSGDSRYRISYCGDGRELCAKLTWLRDDAKSDENLALLNTYVVKNAQPAEANSWVGKMIYNGSTYDATATLVDANAIELKSCAGVLCRSFTLHRH